MSNNPFSKFVVDPSKVPDPNTITAREFENYASTELRRVQSSLRTYRRSAVYLAGCAGLMLVTAWLTGGAARKSVLGTDSNFCHNFQTKEALIWILKLPMTNLTTLIIDNSRECWFWQKVLLQTSQQRAKSC